jgi:hypothetical protein
VFSKLMQHLDTVYKGEIIYIPVKLKPFIEPWLEQRSKGKGFQGRVLGSGGFQSNVNPSTHKLTMVTPMGTSESCSSVRTSY